MSEYTPHNWVVLKIHGAGYKVFGGWSGGYLDGDSWRMNSGITRAYEQDGMLVFEGYSGSRYTVHPENYGIRGMHNTGVLSKFTEHELVSVMAQDTDWLNINYGEYDDNA
jgi:hypothetical protein